MRSIYFMLLLARTTLSCKSAAPRAPPTTTTIPLDNTNSQKEPDPVDTLLFGEEVEVSIDSQCQILKNTMREKNQSRPILSRRKRVVGGQEVDDDEHPWAVKIEYILRNYEKFCGGTLINKFWVLTAAHCFPGFNEQWRLNRINISLYNPVIRNRMLYTPLEIIIHPSYTVSKTLYNYDAALIKLDIPKSIQEQLIPACVSPTLDIYNLEAKIFGWGYVDEDSKQFAENLKEVQQYIYPIEECYYKDAEFMHLREEQTVCAGPEDKTVDDQSICRGDSGGGLMVKEDVNSRTASVVGIASWTFKCAGPAAFQRVAPIHSWLQETIQSYTEQHQDISTSAYTSQTS